jgi:hypothetical protein
MERAQITKDSSLLNKINKPLINETRSPLEFFDAFDTS